MSNPGVDSIVYDNAAVPTVAGTTVVPSTGGFFSNLWNNSVSEVEGVGASLGAGVATVSNGVTSAAAGIGSDVSSVWATAQQQGSNVLGSIDTIGSSLTNSLSSIAGLPGTVVNDSQFLFFGILAVGAVAVYWLFFRGGFDKASKFIPRVG